MTSCSGTVSKVVLCVVNMICLLVALSIIFVGFQLYESGGANGDATSSVTSSSELFLGICTWRTLSITILVIGVVIFFAAILGLCAIMCESPAVLNAYVYLIALGCFVVLAGNFCFWYYSESLTDKASNYYHQLVVNSSSDADAMDVVQQVQLWAYCCGEKTFMDWHNQTVTNRSIDVGLGQFPESCCGKSSSSSMSYATNLTLGYCDGSEVSYYDGCFSSAQVSRYQVFGQTLIVLALFFKLLLLVLSCCLDRDRQLEASKLVNLQYAAHLHVCRSQGGAVAATSAQHYNSMGLSRPRDSWRV